MNKQVKIVNVIFSYEKPASVLIKINPDYSLPIINCGDNCEDSAKKNTIYHTDIISAWNEPKLLTVHNSSEDTSLLYIVYGLLVSKNYVNPKNGCIWDDLGNSVSKLKGDQLKILLESIYKL